MTKQEAISELTRCADICPTTPLAEACRMAVDVLSATTDDKSPHNCINCRHKDRTPAVCRYFRCNMRGDGTLPNGVCVLGRGGYDPMDFCSAGERKDGDHYG